MASRVEILREPRGVVKVTLRVKHLLPINLPPEEAIRRSSYSIQTTLRNHSQRTCSDRQAADRPLLAKSSRFDSQGGQIPVGEVDLASQRGEVESDPPLDCVPCILP